MIGLYLGEYAPPESPRSSPAVSGMGESPFDLYPQGFQNAPVCPDMVFPMLDRADRDAVRVTRLAWAVRNAQDAAINAPFLDIERSKWHG
ncbi:MAG: hypothetical protein WC859_10545 [Elusimicrobiota bacterium]